MKPSALHSMIAVACSAMLLTAPLARAQDDDLPDGDVDIVEKPKKKEEKKPPAKKEEKKKEQKKEEKKKEEKKEPPPKDEKKEPPPKDEKKRDDKPKKDAPLDDDSDILTVPAEGKKAPPSKPAEKAAPAPASDGDEDEEGGGSRIISGDAPPLVIDDEPPLQPKATAPKVTPPKATPTSTPPTASSPRGTPIDDGPMEDDEEPPRKPLAPTGVGDDEDGESAAGDPAIRTVETPVKVPDEAEDDGMGWVIAGATGGGIVLLAGAVAGTWFLVDTLTPKTGSLTVTPH